MSPDVSSMLSQCAKEFQQQGTALQDLSQKVAFYQQGHDLKHRVGHGPWVSLIVWFGALFGKEI